jgi:hypothetical protein
MRDTKRPVLKAGIINSGGVKALVGGKPAVDL